jgi:hypothetical protein
MGWRKKDLFSQQIDIGEFACLYTGGMEDLEANWWEARSIITPDE